MNKEEPFWHKQIFFYDLLGEKRLIMKHKAVSVKANFYVQMGLKFNQSTLFMITSFTNPWFPFFRRNEIRLISCLDMWHCGRKSCNKQIEHLRDFFPYQLACIGALELVLK